MSTKQFHWWMPVLSMLVCAPAAAQATCGGGNTIFACTTTNNKVVEVCDAGKTIEYSFGRRGQKPEMALAIPRARATTSVSSGTGYSTVLVNIPNGDTLYSAYMIEARQGGYDEAGIYVSVKKKNVATIKCKLNSLEESMWKANLKTSDDWPFSWD